MAEQDRTNENISEVVYIDQPSTSQIMVSNLEDPCSSNQADRQKILTVVSDNEDPNPDVDIFDQIMASKNTTTISITPPPPQTVMHPIDRTSKLDQCLHIIYPGIVKNLDRALERLGGVEIIMRNEQYNAQSCLLTDCDPSTSGEPALKSLIGIYKPKAVQSHKTKVSQSGHLLLVVKARRKKAKDDEEKHQSDVKIVGIIQDQYSFKSMCDYAYLPYMRVDSCKTDTPKFKDITREIVPLDINSALSWHQRKPQENILYAPSPVLSRYTIPTVYLLNDPEKEPVKKDYVRMPICGRNHAAIVPKDKDHHLGLSQRKKRCGHNTIVDGTETEWPKAPKEPAVAEADKCIKNLDVHNALADIFNRRPLWTRHGILFNLIQMSAGLTHQQLKQILPKFAFYITAGAFGRLWCRFGYDPRLDTNAGPMYQIIGITFKKQNRFANQPRKSRLSYSHNTGMHKDFKNTNNENVVEVVDESSFKYEPGWKPMMRQLWYCLCDINLPIVHRMLSQKPGKYNATFGFFTEQEIKKVRLAIKENIELHFPDDKSYSATIEMAPEEENDAD